MNKPTYQAQQLLTNWRLGAHLQDDGGLHLILHHGGGIHRLELGPEQTDLLRRALNGQGTAEIQEGGDDLDG